MVQTAFSFLKRVFLPSFAYEYSFPHSRRYIERAAQRLRDLGGERMLTRDEEIICTLPSRSVFGRLSCGRLHIMLSRPSADKMKCRILFLSYRFCFYLAAGLVSSAVVVRSIFTSSIATILVLPVIFFCGHLYFWGMLPAKVSRLKKFIRQLGD